MGCEIRNTGDGGSMIVCGRGQRKRCQARKGCGLAVVALCDYPVSSEQRCDRRLCNEHRRPIGLKKDLCPQHNEVYKVGGNEQP